VHHNSIWPLDRFVDHTENRDGCNQQAKNDDSGLTTYSANVSRISITDHGSEWLLIVDVTCAVLTCCYRRQLHYIRAHKNLSWDLFSLHSPSSLSALLYN